MAVRTSFKASLPSPQTNISEVKTRAVLCVESVVEPFIQYLAIPALCIANVLRYTYIVCIHDTLAIDHV